MQVPKCILSSLFYFNTTSATFISSFALLTRNAFSAHKPKRIPLITALKRSAKAPHIKEKGSAKHYLHETLSY